MAMTTADEICRAARKCIEDDGAAEAENRDLAIEDMEFLAGGQWPASILKERNDEGLPCLIFNRLPQFIAMAVSEQRKNRPAIKVSPRDDGADKETAKTIEGLIRQIEYASVADEAYDRAYEFAVSCGFPGFLRVLTRYSDDDTFNQDIIIRHVPNPHTVYFDAYSREPDYSDARRCAITELMPKAEFEAQYPEKASSSVSGGIGDDDGHAGATEETVRVVEYYWAETVTKTLCLLVDGRAVYKDEVQPEDEIKQEKKVKTRRVMWAKCTDSELLEGPIEQKTGGYIPVVPMCGREVQVGNKVYRYGLIRWAKDPQREYNFLRSKGAEVAALAPKNPLIGTLRNFEGHEDLWATANKRAHSFLPYNPDPLNGGARPSRENPVQVSTAIVQAAAASVEDMKAATGIYDASLGQRSNETSGVAIQARKAQGENATFAYIDNLSRAIRQVGRIVVAMVPHVYDTERQMRVRGEDGSYQDVTLNEGADVWRDIEPGMVKNDLSRGKYDVAVSVGPSYSTQREESRASMLEYFGIDQQAVPLVRDILVGSQDWPKADEMAERFKAALPPGMNGQPVHPDPLTVAKAELTQAQTRKTNAEADVAELHTHVEHADVAHYAMQQAQGDVMPPANMMPAPAGP